MSVRFEKCESIRYPGAPCVKVFYGKQSKPAEYVRFRDEEQREEYIRRIMEGHARSESAKAERKREEREAQEKMRSEIRVGTIFCNSWGYDQTNVDYYEVVKRSKTGATVYVREICCKSVEDVGPMADNVQPIPGEFIEGSLPIKKVVGPHGIQFRHGWTKIVDPDSSHYRSWYH